MGDYIADVMVVDVQKREREFEEYIREKYVQAKGDFRELLKQTKLIDHSTRKKLAENPDYRKDIAKLLEVIRISKY